MSPCPRSPGVMRKVCVLYSPSLSMAHILRYLTWLLKVQVCLTEQRVKRSMDPRWSFRERMFGGGKVIMSLAGKAGIQTVWYSGIWVIMWYYSFIIYIFLIFADKIPPYTSLIIGVDTILQVPQLWKFCTFPNSSYTNWSHTHICFYFYLHINLFLDWF